MDVIQFAFKYFWLIILVILLFILASINTKKRFIKRAKKNGWYVEGKSFDYKYGHYEKDHQTIETIVVTYKYEVDGKNYFVKKKYESRSNTFPDLTRVIVYYKPSNPKKGYIN